MEEQKYADVSGTFISPPGSISARIDTADPDPPVKPPWHRRFIYRNLKWAKALFKVVRMVGSIGSAIGGWQTIWDALKSFLGRKRQPAQVSPPA